MYHKKVLAALEHVREFLPNVVKVTFYEDRWNYQDESGNPAIFGTKKINISLLEEALDSVRELRPITFHINDLLKEKKNFISIDSIHVPISIYINQNLPIPKESFIYEKLTNGQFYRFDFLGTFISIYDNTFIIINKTIGSLNPSFIKIDRAYINISANINTSEINLIKK